MLRPKFKKSKRNANMVIQISLCRQYRKALRQNSLAKFFSGGLAVTSGQANHFTCPTTAMPERKFLQGHESIFNGDHGDIGRDLQYFFVYNKNGGTFFGGRPSKFMGIEI